MKQGFLDRAAWSRRARRALYPPVWAVWTAAVASGVLLAGVFALGLEETPPAYVAYPLSAWALTIVLLRLIPLLRALPDRARSNRHAARILADESLRSRVSLYGGLGASLFYAALKLITGLIYSSKWFMAVAVYYMVLALMRYLLLCGVKSSGAARADTPWRIYRGTGLLMLILTAAIAGLAVQLVMDNQAYEYPGVVIYASAAYTFYSLTLAAVNLIRRRNENPVAAAARMLTFAGALMAIFALQTGMIARFGEGNEAFRYLMNALTGGVVCLSVLCMGVAMVVRAQRRLNRLRREAAR